MDSLVGRLLQEETKKVENLQHGAESSSKATLDAGATRKPAVEDSTRGKEEPAVRHLPVVISSISFSGAAILANHCRELALLAHLQKEKV
jgi:hypothetical protein